MHETFIPFGAQYYRAPTPPESDWARDLDRFAAAGFNTLKYWAQWRWNHPEPDTFFFDDLDRLMDLAAERDLKVVINTIFDCAPTWLYQMDEDVRMLTASGERLGPLVTGCRQIGGSPGPCLNNPHALGPRMAFIEATTRRYVGHPALWLWDTWNEPELQGGIKRQAVVGDLVCYCEHCRAGFIAHLREQLGDMDALNRRWGRNYRSFEDIELPHAPGSINDMIDWRLFQSATVTNEQCRRVEAVRRIDKETPVMCHTVPMPVFDPVTCCADDWELAQTGEYVGNSLGTDPLAADLIAAAGRERPALNAEIHALPGTCLSRPHPLEMDACKRTIFAPLAHRIKGFLFWQYRPELLGLESPAWGLTRPDGSGTPWMDHFAELNRILQEDAEFYWNAQPEGPEVGVLYHPANHVFAWCAQGAFDMHDHAIRGVYDSLYEANFRVRFVHPMELQRGDLDGIQTIVYPFPYVLDQPTADALRGWVERGGHLIGEAFFGNFQREDSLHAQVVPGYGFDRVFGASEGIGTPYSAQINFYEREQGVDATQDGPLIELQGNLPGLETGTTARGYLTRTPLEVRDATVLARFEDGTAAVTRNAFGAGHAILSGTLLSVAAAQRTDARRLLVALVSECQGGERPRVEKARTPVRVDVLRSGKFWAVVTENPLGEPVEGRLFLPGIGADAPLRNVESGEVLRPSRGGWKIALEPRAVEMWRPAT